MLKNGGSNVRFSPRFTGNMLRTTDGKLAILDFGLMTDITDDQKYGMVGKCLSARHIVPGQE